MESMVLLVYANKFQPLSAPIQYGGMLNSSIAYFFLQKDPQITNAIQSIAQITKEDAGISFVLQNFLSKHLIQQIPNFHHQTQFDGALIFGQGCMYFPQFL
jgi:hypothetical protein